MVPAVPVLTCSRYLVKPDILVWLRLLSDHDDARNAVDIRTATIIVKRDDLSPVLPEKSPFVYPYCFKNSFPSGRDSVWVWYSFRAESSISSPSGSFSRMIWDRDDMPLKVACSCQRCHMLLRNRTPARQITTGSQTVNICFFRSIIANPPCGIQSS